MKEIEIRTPSIITGEYWPWPSGWVLKRSWILTMTFQISYSVANLLSKHINCFQNFYPKINVFKCCIQWYELKCNFTESKIIRMNTRSKVNILLIGDRKVGVCLDLHGQESGSRRAAISAMHAQPKDSRICFDSGSLLVFAKTRTRLILIPLLLQFQCQVQFFVKTN